MRMFGRWGKMCGVCVCAFWKLLKCEKFVCGKTVLDLSQMHYQDLFQRILGPLNGPKNSIMNWFSNLHIKNKIFPII